MIIPYNDKRTLLNEMWKALPDYVGNNDEDCLAVVDVSASMNGTPMQMAISLGLYVAEKNKGAFKNHFITFSQNPELIEIIGDDLVGKVDFMKSSNWGYNTNLEAVFDLILNVAIKNNLPQSQLPSRLFVISDMEFDDAIQDNSWAIRKREIDKETLFQTIAKKYKDAGYKVPTLVFWNANSRNDLIPAIEDDGIKVQYASGASPRTFELLLKNETLTALDLMFEAINVERYNCITV